MTHKLTAMLGVVLYVCGCAGHHEQRIASTLDERVQSAFNRAAERALPAILTAVEIPNDQTRAKAITESIGSALTLVPQIDIDGISAELSQAVTSAIAAAEADSELASAQAAKEAVDVVAPFIPGPWSGVLTGLAGLALGLLRARANRKAAVGMAQAIETNKDDAGVLNLTDKITANRVSSAMGASGKRIVDEAQGKVSSLPF